MSVKEYLSQAQYLDAKIQAKIQQVHQLNCLATNATSVLTGMPHNPNKGNSKMADIVGKIVDLQVEINGDIDALVDLKRDIALAIKSVENMEQQTLLEKRYLCFQSWEHIAVEMGYSMRYMYKLHNLALENVVLPTKEDT